MRSLVAWSIRTKLSAPEPRSTTARRNARAGLVAIRIGPRVWWVPTAVARKIERLCDATLPSADDVRGILSDTMEKEG